MNFCFSLMSVHIHLCQDSCPDLYDPTNECQGKFALDEPTTSHSVSVNRTNVEGGVSIDLFCSTQCCDSCTAGQLPAGGGSNVDYHMDGSSHQCDEHAAVPG